MKITGAHHVDRPGEHTFHVAFPRGFARPPAAGFGFQVDEASVFARVAVVVVKWHWNTDDPVDRAIVGVTMRAAVNAPDDCHPTVHYTFDGIAA